MVKLFSVFDKGRRKYGAVRVAEEYRKT